MGSDSLETQFCTPGNPPYDVGECVITSDDVAGTVTRAYAHDNKYSIQALGGKSELRGSDGSFRYFAKDDLRRAAPFDDEGELVAKRARLSSFRDAEIAASIESQPWRCAGRVLWFNKEKGYGKIRPILVNGKAVTSKSETVFLHAGQAEGGPDGEHAQVIAEGVAVTYEDTLIDNKPCAKAVQVLGISFFDGEDFGVRDEDRHICLWLLSSLHMGTHKVTGRFKATSEDRCMTRLGVPINLGGTSESKVICGLFGVFDGHSGDLCSEFASSNFESVLFDCMKTRSLARTDGKDVYTDEIIEAAFSAAFRRIEHDYFQRLTTLRGPALTAWEAAGSTACTMLVFGPDEDGRIRLIVANAGDCRAVLGKRDGRAVRLSEDHTPDVPSERKRIEKQGAKVVEAGQGIWRVMLPRHAGSGLAGLSVARGFGDLEYKKPAGVVSAEPDILVRTVDPDEDAFVIMASDGVWGPVPDSEAVRVVASGLHSIQGDNSAKARGSAQSLCEMAHQREPTDDKTAIVICFGDPPTVKAAGAAAAPPAAATPSTSTPVLGQVQAIHFGAQRR